jgi:hypothetical protein
MFVSINKNTIEKENLTSTSNKSASTEEFEDTKGVIIIRILKKNRQHNEQKKNYL